MKKSFSIASIAGALVTASAMTASAGLIDFTDDNVDLVVPGVYEVTGKPNALNRNDLPPFSPIALTNGDSLVADNDGLGIFDDEISTDGPGGIDQFVTVTFEKEVKLVAAYFLDVFISSNGNTIEEAFVTLGDMPNGADGSAAATQTVGTGEPGLVEITGLNLRGKEFTFWVGRTNDAQGFADGAFAALEVAPVPLPASALLLLGAVGGLAAARRRKA